MWHYLADTKKEKLNRDKEIIWQQKAMQYFIGQKLE